MSRKKKEADETKINPNVMGLSAEIIEQPVTDCLRNNFMPYGMSVILSRAIVGIDGFKPSHRKLLYTMYKMGLLNSARTKSANIVGQTMKLNPHGDMAIYETMVRLSTGNGALLHPFIDSKGNFGKSFSRDMAFAASRYTEAKLSNFSEEIFKDINSDAVDFVDNYDGTLKEPSMLPTTFPNVLVSANMGIAVGMASNICGFNIKEICEATIAKLNDKNADIYKIITGPDFPTGGEYIYNEEKLKEVIDTGRGIFTVRSKWRYDKKSNVVEIYEIPYTTTTEAIMDKVADLIRTNKIREISDMRDETDLNGLKLAIDLKRGVDPEKLMAKLMKLTPMQDNFSCNFNILIDGKPMVLGVSDILNQWISWRSSCVKRRCVFDRNKKAHALHLLEGLEKILVDIDKAIKIIRETEKEKDVVPNLIKGFGIDETQAEYIADIKLRNINKEYILKRTKDIESLRKDIKHLDVVIKSSKKVHKIISDELNEIIKKYGIDRKTAVVYDVEENDTEVQEEIPDYPVNIFITKEGYLKKITPKSLRMSGSHKLKDGDEIVFERETTNNSELLVFTDKYQVYKTNLNEFSDTKTSALGDYLPTVLDFENDENYVAAFLAGNYKGQLLFVYQNGKAVKVPVQSYWTKQNRKKLLKAYSDTAPLMNIYECNEDFDLLIETNKGKVIINTLLVTQKSSRNSQGASVISLKKNEEIIGYSKVSSEDLKKYKKFVKEKIPCRT